MVWLQLQTHKQKQPPQSINLETPIKVIAISAYFQICCNQKPQIAGCSQQEQVRTELLPIISVSFIVYHIGLFRNYYYFFFSKTGMQQLSMTQNPSQQCLCCGLHFLLGSARLRSGGEPYEVEDPLLWVHGMPVWNQCSRFPLVHWGLCSIK